MVPGFCRHFRRAEVVSRSGKGQLGGHRLQNEQKTRVGGQEKAFWKNRVREGTLQLGNAGMAARKS